MHIMAYVRPHVSTLALRLRHVLMAISFDREGKGHTTATEETVEGSSALAKKHNFSPWTDDDDD